MNITAITRGARVTVQIGRQGSQGEGGAQGPIGPTGEVSLAYADANYQPLDSDLTTISTSSPGALFGYGTDSAGAKGFYRPALFESTGVLSGLQLSINADPTKFNIGVGVAGYVDTSSSPTQPTRSFYVASSPVTGITITNLATARASYVGVDQAGAVHQQVDPFTNTQRRTIAVLGLVIHSNQIIANAVNTIKSVLLSGINQLHDYLEYRGPLSRGLNLSANGANLNVDRSDGSMFKFGSNFHVSALDPHVTTLSAAPATAFRYRTQLLEVSGDVTVIDPNQYDVGGTLTPVASNRFTIQHVAVFQSGLTRVQYGQTLYTSMDEAIAAATTETYVTESNIALNGVLRCLLVVRGGTTSLADTARARFLNVGNVGVFSAPGAGQTVAGGTWTPVATIVTNLDSVTPRPGAYAHVAGAVSFVARVTVDPTASGPIRLGISLPVSSEFTTVYDAGATVTTTATSPTLGRAEADVANNRLDVIVENSSTTAYDVLVSGVYLVLSA